MMSSSITIAITTPTRQLEALQGQGSSKQCQKALIHDRACTGMQVTQTHVSSPLDGVVCC